MNNNIRELLPIGSVVLLDGGRKKVMIFGVKQKDNATQKEYDYIGVVYPEGNMGAELQFYFAHENIKEVIFRGYEDDERNTFIERLANYYDRQMKI